MDLSEIQLTIRDIFKYLLNNVIIVKCLQNSHVILNSYRDNESQDKKKHLILFIFCIN